MIRIEASAICSHGMCEGVPADSCSDTDSVGTVVVFEASTEGSMKVSSVFNVKASGGSSTAVLCTGSDTAWPSDSTSSMPGDADRAASSLAAEDAVKLASESGTGDASSVTSQGITSGRG